jgi:hypothetical protein
MEIESKNLVHKRCGKPVNVYRKPRGENEYFGECQSCDEDVYSFECNEVTN